MDLATQAASDSATRQYAREEIAAGIERTLHGGGWGNPDVLLVCIDGTHFVVKDFAARSRLVRTLFGRWLLRREARAYARLDDLPEVPRLLGWVDRDALMLEYRPGVLLSRSLAGRLSSAFMPQLERGVAGMHARGVVHLDLRHRSNILAGDDGRPVILDFASALCFDPARASGRVALRLAAWIDRRALEKWRIRLVPTPTPTLDSLQKEPE